MSRDDKDSRLGYVDYHNMSEIEVADFAFDWQFYYNYRNRRPCKTEAEKMEYLNKLGFKHSTFAEVKKQTYAKNKNMENLYEQEKYN